MNSYYGLGLLPLLGSLMTSLDLDQAETGFQTEIEAVEAATNRFNPRSIREDREYMGTVFKIGDYYGFSVTDGQARSDSIQIKIATEDWEMVTAFWHTHGGRQSQYRYFSDVDTALANKLNKPLYLADYTGYLKVYRPRDNTLSRYVANRLGLPSKAGYAIGSFVRDRFERIIMIETRARRRQQLSLSI